MKNLVLMLSIFHFFSCKSNTIVTIKGQIQNLPDGKIYLLDPGSSIMLDSTVSNGGAFTFQRSIDSTFEPTLCMVAMKKGEEIKPFIYSLDETFNGKKQGASAFMLEEGETTITGTYDTANRFMMMSISAGPQSKVYHKIQLANFGFIPDNTDRTTAISSITSTIKKYPHAFILLQKLYNNKQQYEKDELRALISHFDNSVRSGHTAASFEEYIRLRPDKGASLAGLTLSDSLGTRYKVFNEQAKVNMIVFWASWCGPCLLEIPGLKKIYSDFHGSTLKMVSISIDEKKENWLAEMRKQQMPWPQYIIDEGTEDKINAGFRFAAIPVVILTDANGVEVKRFSGYSEKNHAAIRSYLEQTLR